MSYPRSLAALLGLLLPSVALAQADEPSFSPASPQFPSSYDEHVDVLGIPEVDVLFKCHADQYTVEGALGGLAHRLSRRKERVYSVLVTPTESRFGYVQAPFQVSPPAFFEQDGLVFACVTVQSVASLTGNVSKPPFEATQSLDDSFEDAVDAAVPADDSAPVDDALIPADDGGILPNAADMPEVAPAPFDPNDVLAPVLDANAIVSGMLDPNAVDDSLAAPAAADASFAPAADANSAAVDPFAPASDANAVDAAPVAGPVVDANAFAPAPAVDANAFMSAPAIDANAVAPAPVVDANAVVAGPAPMVDANAVVSAPAPVVDANASTPAPVADQSPAPLDPNALGLDGFAGSNDANAPAPVVAPEPVVAPSLQGPIFDGNSLAPTGYDASADANGTSGSAPADANLQTLPAPATTAPPMIVTPDIASRAVTMLWPMSRADLPPASMVVGGPDSNVRIKAEHEASLKSAKETASAEPEGGDSDTKSEDNGDKDDATPTESEDGE